MSLYPKYKPFGVRKDWEHTSVEEFGSGEVMRRHGIAKDWGNPTEAVAWFEIDGDGLLRILVADYPNGRRVTLRKCKHGAQLEVATTRDSRAVERKKYGKAKARRSFQFSKR